MKFLTRFLIVVCTLFILPAVVLADAAPGDVIITLGEDLTKQQKDQLLNEMGAAEDVEPVIVTNKEEHQYLGDYISKSQIGTRAISSSKITIGKKGSGLNVETNNITWVSEEMYANALITAGVKDADIYVTAPFEVSGTAALTGIIKAYEVTANIKIPEEQKKVANEEMVKTAELGDKVGVEKANELMSRIKEEIAKNPPENEEDLRSLIKRLAEELGIQLTDEELNGLVSLFNRMKDLNIDWDQVTTQLEKVRDNLDEFLNREETKSFIQRFIDFVISVIEDMKSWFKS
ncbi:DUF1002 domain-containing protein [Pueribacillus theae]|uniref:DUF1002 domain-containing protein n=1 Tax=Pueribacillus theae TaxID=2171751 RepID=A0A2U1JIV8_9BACI|nr:DUF1002 domain-containing protein [Pueribacillus theae]PWA04818.1 DUF1002 domain-containing protein [Pueribacillus theae]